MLKTVNINDKIHEQLIEFSDRTGISLKTLVENALIAFIKNNQHLTKVK